MSSLDQKDALALYGLPNKNTNEQQQNKKPKDLIFYENKKENLNQVFSSKQVQPI